MNYEKKYLKDCELINIEPHATALSWLDDADKEVADLKEIIYRFRAALSTQVLMNMGEEHDSEKQALEVEALLGMYPIEDIPTT